MLLSDAQSGAGRTEEARATLKDLLRADPDSVRARARLAELYDRQRRFGDFSAGRCQTHAPDRMRVALHGVAHAERVEQWQRLRA